MTCPVCGAELDRGRGAADLFDAWGLVEGVDYDVDPDDQT